MDNMSYPPNTPQYPQQPPPYAVQSGGAPVGAPGAQPKGQPTKSGCGCCGCLFGCLAVLLIPPIILLILYFTVDVGKYGDQAAVWSYYNLVRPQMEEKLKSSPDADKQKVLAVTDHYVDAYQKLPDAERKLVRQEALTYFYYESQNQKAPPEKVQHLQQFLQSQMQILQQKGLPSVPPPSTSPSAPPAAPPPSLPMTPRAPPPPPAERPTLLF